MKLVYSLYELNDRVILFTISDTSALNRYAVQIRYRVILKML